MNTQQLATLNSWTHFAASLNLTSPHPDDIERFAAFVADAYRHEARDPDIAALFLHEFSEQASDDVLKTLAIEFDRLFVSETDGVA